MRVTLAVLALAASAVAQPSPPVFPLSWSSNEFAILTENGGSETMQGTAYWQQDNKHNRTAFISSNGGVSTVTDYDTNNIWYIEGGVCQYYCPMLGDEICNEQDSLCTYDYVHGAAYTGSTSFNGQSVNVFAWNEDLGPIVMNSLILYTVPNQAVPVFQARKLTPFGNFIGWINTTWTNFTAGTPSPNAFVVPNEQYCQQADDSTCQDAVSAVKMAQGSPSLTTAFLKALANTRSTRVNTRDAIRDPEALLETLSPAQEAQLREYLGVPASTLRGGAQ